jgi:hypothetical protein
MALSPAWGHDRIAVAPETIDKSDSSTSRLGRSRSTETYYFATSEVDECCGATLAHFQELMSATQG